MAINIVEELNVSEYLASAIPLFILSLIMFKYLKKTGINKSIGLTNRFNTTTPKMLYYMPLILFAFIPLLYGINQQLSNVEVIAALVMMLAVGFLEEVIFRGLLFKSLLKKWKPLVVILFVSLTFGFGHITSLLIGEDLLLTLLQIVNATIVGLMFLLVVIATNNLIPVIIIHGLYNFFVTISLLNTSSTSLLVINSVISINYSLYMVMHLKTTDKIMKSDLLAK